MKREGEAHLAEETAQATAGVAGAFRVTRSVGGWVGMCQIPRL